jgi:hypothetical protein
VTVEEAEQELARVTQQIERPRGELDALYERRRFLFRFLLDNGMRQVDIARVAKVSPTAVLLSVGKARKLPKAQAKVAGQT